MMKWRVVSGIVCVLASALAISVQAERHEQTLAVIMTNDPVTNQVKVYDTASQTLLQTLPTEGKGGVSGNARGVRQYRGELVAAVNNGSNSVAIYTRQGNGLKFDRLVTTSSAPVSIDFGNGHRLRMQAASKRKKTSR